MSGLWSKQKADTCPTKHGCEIPVLPFHHRVNAAELSKPLHDRGEWVILNLHINESSLIDRTVFHGTRLIIFRHVSIFKIIKLSLSPAAVFFPCYLSAEVTFIECLPPKLRRYFYFILLFFKKKLLTTTAFKILF